MTDRDDGPPLGEEPASRQGEMMMVHPPQPIVVHTFLEQHQNLSRRIAELRRWWSELDALGTRKFGEMAFRMQELRDLLTEHFDEEERDGYLASALAVAPHFSVEAADLCRQHPHFLDRLDNQIARVRASEPSSEYWRAARDELEQLLTDLRRHEQSENAIVQTAFQVDVGTKD
ncbi:MAG TPA: hemerythrin domain-containing protein [Planctomycetaceae bacterium]|nr:hemerythrin domain-containing protein [Planctomycetaceae bacterium]